MYFSKNSSNKIPCLFTWDELHEDVHRGTALSFEHTEILCYERVVEGGQALDLAVDITANVFSLNRVIERNTDLLFNNVLSGGKVLEVVRAQITIGGIKKLSFCGCGYFFFYSEFLKIIKAFLLKRKKKKKK